MEIIETTITITSIQSADPFTPASSCSTHTVGYILRRLREKREVSSFENSWKRLKWHRVDDNKQQQTTMIKNNNTTNEDSRLFITAPTDVKSHSKLYINNIIIPHNYTNVIITTETSHITDVRTTTYIIMFTVHGRKTNAKIVHGGKGNRRINYAQKR